MMHYKKKRIHEIKKQKAIKSFLCKEFNEKCKNLFGKQQKLLDELIEKT